MLLDTIVHKIGARVLTPYNIVKMDIRRVYAGDKMSDILNEVSNDTLLVTSLNNQQLIRVSQPVHGDAHISADHFRDHFVDGTRGTKAQGARLEVEVSHDTNDPHAQDILLDSIEVA